MKYKIGELEVEAVQWNGANDREIFFFLLDKNLGGIYINNESPKLKISHQGDEKGSASISDFVVVSDKELIIMKESTLNKIATKVKEPKFKVGDVVYSFKKIENRDGTKMCKIWKNKIKKHVKGEIYNLEHHLQNEYYESELFTLEEAIEKLKEL